VIDIEISYTLTVDEAVQAMQSRVSQSWTVRLLWIATGLFTLITIGLGIVNGDVGIALTAIVPIILVFGLYIFFYLGPFARTRMSKEARFFIEQTWRFTEEGTTHQTQYGESRHAWAAFVRAGETPQFFFLFLNQNQIAPLPKRAFANLQEQTRFRELLKRKLKFVTM
jgi:hypothetical protein